MTQWIKLGALEEFPRLGARTVQTAEGDIAIFRGNGDEIYAVADRCPHRGGRLSQGIVHGNKVTCPLHNWVIDLSTGGAVAPDEGCVNRYPVRIENQTIYLSTKTE